MFFWINSHNNDNNTLKLKNLIIFLTWIFFPHTSREKNGEKLEIIFGGFFGVAS
jgi:hypothetical protein